ncbi:hypothetical protein [Microbacterium esteraromaticum]|uniref:hypothetical protein n=1 Tax=Microbacterium esteraromaticum TaxID=57043 RepID=UPI00195992F8|nr:hypothetical protein [Microbacterium esteraromaticum]MBM7465575.1 hypothetical protein [Microbacterium esteraromaticum]
MAIGFGLAAIAVIALMLLAVAVFLWMLGRGLLGNGERAMLATERLAWAAVAVFVGTAVIGAIVDLTSPEVTMELPVMNVWPLPLPDVQVEAGDATVRSAGMALAQMTLEGVSTAARALWAAGQALSLLLPATVALLVALALREVRTGAPFSRVMLRMTTVSAAAILVAGMGAPILRGISGSMASHEALSLGGASWTGYPDEWMPMDQLPEPTVFVQWDFWPIGVAAGLLVLGAILRMGRRLQKDTEGLV